MKKFLKVPKASKYSFFCKEEEEELTSEQDSLGQSLVVLGLAGRELIFFSVAACVFNWWQNQCWYTPSAAVIAEQGLHTAQATSASEAAPAACGESGQEAGRGHTWETWALLSEQGLAGVSAAPWGQPTTWINQNSRLQSTFEIWAQAAAKLRFKIMW